MALFALLAGSLTLLAASPAAAKKKAAEPAPAPATDDEKPADATSDAKPAEQAQDTEKPKAILDTGQEAPKTDSLGHIHFASPNGEGLGRVAVTAPPEAKVKIFLEGRYFGTAPVTIYSIPKGDYILEAAYPSGKQVSKPVTVAENEETAIDLGGAKIAAASASGGGSGLLNAEMTPNRMHYFYGSLALTGVGVIAAVTFGILELGQESDYRNSTTQAGRDSATTSGNRDALISNIGIIAAVVGAVGVAVTGYPLVLKPSEKSASTVSLLPVAAPGSAGGTFVLRF